MGLSMFAPTRMIMILIFAYQKLTFSRIFSIILRFVSLFMLYCITICLELFSGSYSLPHAICAIESNVKSVDGADALALDLCHCLNMFCKFEVILRDEEPRFSYIL